MNLDRELEMYSAGFENSDLVQKGQLLGIWFLDITGISNN